MIIIIIIVVVILIIFFFFFFLLLLLLFLLLLSNINLERSSISLPKYNHLPIEAGGLKTKNKHHNEYTIILFNNDLKLSGNWKKSIIIVLLYLTYYWRESTVSSINEEQTYPEMSGKMKSIIKIKTWLCIAWFDLLISWELPAVGPRARADDLCVENNRPTPAIVPTMHTGINNIIATASNSSFTERDQNKYLSKICWAHEHGNRIQVEVIILEYILYYISSSCCWLYDCSACGLALCSTLVCFYRLAFVDLHILSCSWKICIFLQIDYIKSNCPSLIATSRNNYRSLTYFKSQKLYLASQ